MEKATKCDMCSEDFKSLGKLNAHIERQQKRVCDSKKKMFKCNMCGYEFSDGRQSINHMRTHTGEKPFKCAVSECGIAFALESSLKSHIGRKHSDERAFKCNFPACLYTAKTNADLISHRKVHSDDRPFACLHSGCDFRAKRKGDLSQHAAGVHSDSKTLTCSKCEYSTNIGSHLARHKIVHGGRNVKVPCFIDGCGFKGKNSRALKGHMHRHKTHLTCPVSACGRQVSTQEALKNHLKLHNPSGRAFQCPLCSKHFQTLHHLQIHCTVHTNEKPFQCGHCKYEAATRSQVKGHISSVHAAIDFPLIVHLLDDRECLRCKVTLPKPEFVVHCKGHYEPVLMT